MMFGWFSETTCDCYFSRYLTICFAQFLFTWLNISDEYWEYSCMEFSLPTAPCLTSLTLCRTHPHTHTHIANLRLSFHSLCAQIARKYAWQMRLKSLTETFAINIFRVNISLIEQKFHICLFMRARLCLSGPFNECLFVFFFSQFSCHNHLIFRT